MYDLPSEKDDFHFLQSILLFLTFLPVNWNQEQVYSAADLNLYYDVRHPQQNLLEKKRKQHKEKLKNYASWE